MVDKQIQKIRQMAAGCEPLQYLVKQSCTTSDGLIQPNTQPIDRALSESHVDTITTG